MEVPTVSSSVSCILNSDRITVPRGRVSVVSALLPLPLPLPAVNKNETMIGSTDVQGGGAALVRGHREEGKQRQVQWRHLRGGICRESAREGASVGARAGCTQVVVHLARLLRLAAESGHPAGTSPQTEAIVATDSLDHVRQRWRT